MAAVLFEVGGASGAVFAEKRATVVEDEEDPGGGIGKGTATGIMEGS